MAGKKRDRMLVVRVSAEEHVRYEELAARLGSPLSRIIREHLRTLDLHVRGESPVDPDETTEEVAFRVFVVANDARQCPSWREAGLRFARMCPALLRGKGAANAEVASIVRADGLAAHKAALLLEVMRREAPRCLDLVPPPKREKFLAGIGDAIAREEIPVPAPRPTRVRRRARRETALS